MFGEELVIGSVKTQVNRLNELLTQLELDERWEDHGPYYAGEMRNIEKQLRKIRKADFETIYREEGSAKNGPVEQKKKGRR